MYDLVAYPVCGHLIGDDGGLGHGDLDLFDDPYADLFNEWVADLDDVDPRAKRNRQRTTFFLGP